MEGAAWGLFAAVVGTAAAWARPHLPVAVRAAIVLVALGALAGWLCWKVTQELDE